MTVADPADVIAPTILDAYASPDLMLPLVLSNLISTSLWTLSKTVAQRAQQTAASASPDDTLHPSLRAVQQQIDRSFEHLPSSKVRDVLGEIDLDAARIRLGDQVVRAAVAALEQSFIQRAEAGAIPQEVMTETLARIRAGRFPNYTYSNFDIVHARRKLIKRKKAPYGLTSCLDEVAIFAALAMTLPYGTIDRVIVLGSPTHYTAFGWNEAGATWWFYMKHGIKSGPEWHCFTAADFAGDGQAAFDAFLPDFDRIIGPKGRFDFKTGRSSIPADILAQHLKHLEAHFGLRLRQIEEAISLPRITEPESRLAPIFSALLGVGSLEAVRQTLQASDDPDLRIVLYAYRTIQLPDLSPYLRAARRSMLPKNAADALAGMDDAIAFVRAIPGRISIFDDRDRLALPEETLLFQTGTDRDLALLLHVLLEEIAARQPDGTVVRTVLTADTTFVCQDGIWIDLTDFARIDPPADLVPLAVIIDDQSAGPAR